MIARWHRVVTGFGLALAGALLTGCHAQGTFDVLSEERIAVDLIVTGADVNCPHGADALKLTVTTTIDQYGDQVCHVTGETQATYFSPFGITVSPAAEYLVLQANLAGGRDSWPEADIAVRFPGKVMDASLGVVSDNVVRITDLEALTQGSGLHAVGLASPGPPQWMLAAAAGAGAGAGVTLVVGLIVLGARRSRRRRAAVADDLAFPEPSAHSSAAPSPTVDTARAAPGPPVDPAPAEPVPVSSAGQPPASPADTSWFAQPPATSDPPNGRQGHRPAANGVESHARRSAPALQHSTWARPPDSSDDGQAG